VGKAVRNCVTNCNKHRWKFYESRCSF